jgi:diguanylate cyclase (GGDEF)-like protein
MPARVARDDGDWHPAQILDFCVGGLFLRVEGQEDDALVMGAREVASGDLLEMVFEAASDTGDSREFQVPVQVVRLFGGGMGVAFAPPRPEAIRALGRVAEAEGAPPPAAAPDAQQGEAPPTGDAAGTLRTVRQRLEGWVREHLDAVFRRGSDELFIEARDAQSNEVQTQCLDAQQDLERVAPAVSEGALVGVMRAMDRLISGVGDAGSAENGEGVELDGGLSLVDTGSFDDWVTAKNIVMRHEPKLRDAAYALGRRLSLVAGREVDELSNPAGVQHLVASFNEAMQNLGLPRRARQKVYEALEAALVRELGALYEDLNGLLVERGVLPKVERPAQQQIKRSTSAPHPARAPASEPPPEGPADAGGWQQQPGESPESPGWQPPPSGGPPGSPGWPQPPPAGRPGSGGWQQPPPDAPPGSAGWQPPPGGPPGAAGWQPSPGEPTGPGGSQPPPAGPPDAGGWQPPPGGSPGPGGWQPPPGGAPGPGGWQPPPGGAPGPEGTQQMPPGGAPGVGGESQLPAGTGAIGGAVHPASPQAGVTEPDASAESAPSAFQPTYYSPIRSAVAQVGMAQAYQAARGLMGLQRAMSTGRPVAPGAVSTNPPSAALLSGHLMQALDQLQASEEYQAPPAAEDMQLQGRLHGVLDHEGVSLSSEESEAVDVLTGLIEAVVQDPLIEGNVKPRIQRLAVPMLKAALKDQSFFTEEAHPVRQVVNRLGMMALPESLPEGEEGDSLAGAVDPLVDRLLREGEVGPNAFEEVLPELDAIVQRQAERFGHNLEEIAESRERQQALVAERRGGEAPVRRRVAPELQPWFRRTERLKAGDMVTFDAGTDHPHPRTVAWVADDHETFVFTDRNGRQVSSLDQQELALEMLRGKARILDSTDVPAMDRGVYEMLHRIHQSVAEEARRDAITGLMSMAHFEARVAEAIVASQRRGSRHAMLALNLDGFSTINEKCGRRAGDSLLRKLGRLMKRQLNGIGCVTRSHADEFLVLLEEHELADARRFAERQVRAIENSRVVFEGEQYPITASVGLVPITRAGEAVDTMIERAVAALAGAKRRGGNQLRVFEEEDLAAEEGAQAPQEAAAQDLGTLLDAGRLVLRRHAVDGVAEARDVKQYFEVLPAIRGEDGELVEVSRDLVAEAESDGRMVDVDRWVIENTLAWMKRNRREVIRSGGYAINLSGATLEQDGLLNYVVGQLTESAVPPAKVIFEVTESVAIDRLSGAVEFIRTLRDYGCRFSIDDFGAGHATFSYLKTLPVDFVKIDAMFVRELAENEADYAMVKSINEIAHLLGKQTIAESADSDAVVEKLRELEVDLAQGAAVAAPEPMED